MNVAEILEKKYGVLTDAKYNPLVDELTTTQVVVLGNNPNRLAWSIVNLSDTDCYIAWDTNVGTDHGVLLTANGGSASMRMDEDFEATCWAVHGISTAVNKDIFVLEIEIVGPLPERG